MESAHEAMETVKEKENIGWLFGFMEYQLL